MSSGRTDRILIIVQNLPVPMDRRVWMECRALRAAGYQVSVICPRGPFGTHEELDGVHIYRYREAPEAAGVLGYLLEFVYCWLRTALLSVRVRMRHGFDVMQACNPPDTYWLLAAMWRPFGVKFVFDHHDLNPELFRSRFGEPTGLLARLQLRTLLMLERRTYQQADHVVVTNESYRDVALRRGGLEPGDVTIVRSGPDTTQMRPVHPDPMLRQGARHLVAYLGIMGPQDGVDVLLRSLHHLVVTRGRRDVHAVLMGFGDCLEPMRELAVDLGLADHVTFTGRVGSEEIARHLSTASVGLCPDLKSPLNDVSTMNKTMEYMAYALPVVSYDLAETRVSAGDCAVYVPSGDVAAFADAVGDLLDDDDRRRAMSLAARRRCSTGLDWAPQAANYVSVFDRLAGRRALSATTVGAGDPAVEVTARPERRTSPGRPPVVNGLATVDLRDPVEVQRMLDLRDGASGAVDAEFEALRAGTVAVDARSTSE